MIVSFHTAQRMIELRKGPKSSQAMQAERQSIEKSTENDAKWDEYRESLKTRKVCCICLLNYLNMR